ncbi:unnamed protein product [Auanema sp. JU1783]|nr:unnamed protein product [Auanema sp. JU1783]
MSFSIVISALASFISAASCLVFSVLFNRAMSGFSRQINAFVKVGDFGSIYLQVVVFIIVLVFISYLFVSYLSSAKVIEKTSCLGTFCMLLLSSFSSQAFMLCWVLLSCFVSAVTIVYFIFIGGIYSFCSLLDQQCFDFKVLIPAIVNRISNKKIDLVFCEEKKELLCSADNNQIWNFIIAFICCLITFFGLMLIQNCILFGIGKKSGKSSAQARLKEEIELKGL